MGMKNKIVGAVVAGLAVIGLGVGVPGTASASDVPPVPDGFHEIESLTPAVPDGHAICLDVTNGSTSPGAVMQVFHCHGSDPNGAPQLWEFVKQFDGNYLIEQKDGLCLAPAGNALMMVAMTQEPCRTTVGQEWMERDSALGNRATELEDASVPITGPLCLAIRRGTSPTDHVGVTLLACDTVGTNQFWLL